ncbi:MAG: DVU0298 family protein [Thermodesulfobacteriota bacterium]
MNIKAVKNRIRLVFEKKEPETNLKEICRLFPFQTVNALFSFLYGTDTSIRWQAVSAMGEAVNALAERDLEASRVVMRRLMWNLNEESGGIGWGSPEAFGEICARNAVLASEYAKILISYIDPHQNFIENPLLQQGILWGISRIAHVRPHVVREAPGHLVRFLESSDPNLRGVAVFAASAFHDPRTDPFLEALSEDSAEIVIFMEQRLQIRKISSLASRLI